MQANISKIVFLILTIGLIGLHSIAQVPASGLYSSAKAPFSGGLGSPKINVNVGTQVGTTFNHQYWFTNYVAPSVSYNLTKRFSLILSTGVAYTSYHNSGVIETPDGNYIPAVNSMSLFAGASGIYKLNDKTSLSGNVFVERLNVENQNNMNSRYNVNDFSVGVHYKPTSNLYLNASFGVSNAPSPYVNNLGGAFINQGFSGSHLGMPNW